MTFRIAVVQPITNPIGEDEKNVADAVNFIARAKAEGADFVCFPETYPGPWRMPASFDPTPRLAEAAAKHGINAVYGTIEPLSHNEGTAYNLICMAFGDGRPPVSYRRTIRTDRGSIPAASGGNSNTCPETNFRYSTPHTAKSASPCAAKPICRRSHARWRCAAPN